MSRWSGRDRLAWAAAVLGPLAVSLACVPFRATLANTHVALLLVVVIVAVAALGNRPAGIVAALMSGACFDFFFTAPYQRLAITDRQDVETFLLLLAVGVAVTEPARWGRRQQEHAAREAGYLAGLQAAAAAGTTGASATEVVRDARARLVEVLDLADCRFERGVAGLGDPPRLLRDVHAVTPRADFAWPTGGHRRSLLRFLLLGSGHLAAVTVAVLRNAEPDPARRPRIHVGP